MNPLAEPPLVAVDVGNTRIKLGLFAPRPTSTQVFPEPVDLRTVSADDGDFTALAEWLHPYPPADCQWWIASVNRPAASRLVDWLRTREPAAPLTLICADDLPLTVELPRPDMVGVDRLLAAVAANRLRAEGQAAVVVCLGSAITVNWITPQGAFAGGAILPGLGMSARAMHDYTDLLPLVEYAELAEPPPPVGVDTRSAMRAGLFWGAVGGVRELVQRMAPTREPLVLLTGGAAASVAGLFGDEARFLSELVLAGIALTAWHHERDAAAG